MANLLRQNTDFLGRGVIRPLRRDRKNDFANATGAALVAAAVGQILGTRASDEAGSSKGEIPWRTGFGSLLHLIRHRSNTPLLQELAKFYVIDALKRWEPRVRVTAVDVLDAGDVRPTDRRKLVLRVRFDVTDRLGNVVLPNQDASVPM